MGLTLHHEVLELPFRDPFRIARPEHRDAATTVIVELADAAGAIGTGEAFPVPYYGETADTVAAVLPRLLEAAESVLPPSGEWDVVALAAAAAAMDAALGHNSAAKAGIDIALHDLSARRRGQPLWQFLGTGGELPPTDFSIGLDEPAIVAERARRAAAFPALKIKVGGPRDLATLEAVRAVFDGPIRVDANTGWTLDEALALLPELERLGVELIEQPFPAHRLDLLGGLQARSALPVVADESAVTIDDLDRLRGVVAAVNVKLMKCGGVGPARRMLARARELGFRTMLGCMEETSVGIGAAAAVAALADWVDLDGNLLLADDPFEGLELGPDHRWRLSSRPGLGLSRVVR